MVASVGDKCSCNYKEGTEKVKKLILDFFSAFLIIATTCYL